MDGISLDLQSLNLPFRLNSRAGLASYRVFFLSTAYHYEHITHQSFNSLPFADLGICHFNRAHAKN